MKLPTSVATFLTTAGSKALATQGPAGLNVVPVSAINLTEDVVYLYDFFMDKTANNLKHSSEASLVCWDGMCGVQIKFAASYKQAGDEFAAAVVWANETFPDRTLHGLICLKPQEIHDISIAGNKVVD